MTAPGGPSSAPLPGNINEARHEPAKNTTAGRLANARRQATYKKRHLLDVDGMGERLDQIVSVHAKRQLERLARHYRVTLRAMLERLLLDADREVTAGMGSVDYDTYADGPARLHKGGG